MEDIKNRENCVECEGEGACGNAPYFLFNFPVNINYSKK